MTSSKSAEPPRLTSVLATAAQSDALFGAQASGARGEARNGRQEENVLRCFRRGLTVLSGSRSARIIESGFVANYSER